MRAVQCIEYGEPEGLVVVELDDLEPGKGQVRIRVEGCGVNFPDTLIIQNKYQVQAECPFSPGGEVAGVIDMLGEGVEGWAVGDPVIFMHMYGGFAEQVIAPVGGLLRRPASMPGDIAAGFALTYGTTYHALKQRGDLQPGDKVLVLGAGGGVGLAACEIARCMGATVIAAASSAEKLDAAKNAGADHLINYSEADLRDKLKEIAPDGVDVVYDPVGGPLAQAALRSLAWAGRYLVIGFASGEIPKLPANIPLLKSATIAGVFWGAFRQRNLALDNQNFEQLFAWYEQGKLRPFVSKTYPLEHAANALRSLMNREAIGKLVLKP